MSATDIRFETLFEQAPFSVQLLAPDGRTLRVNKAWEALWQATDAVKAYVLNEYNILADPQLEAKGTAALLRRAFAGESVELPAIYYDPAELGLEGRPRWVKAQAHPVRGADGAVTEVMLIHQDVSDQVEAEQALRSSELRLKQLANTIPQLAWMADPDGHIHWYNERWYAYTGTSFEQMAGWQDVHDPAVLPAVVERWKHSLGTGEPFQMTFPLRGRDGRFRPFLTLVAPLKDASGEVVQWFGTNTDVSELQQAQEQLREADRRKDEFLATLAHELRNPLAPVRTALHVLRMAGDDTRLRAQMLETMERQVNHTVRLVDDLLEVSRITRGKIELRKELVSLDSVVHNALETVDPMLKSSGSRLTIQLPAQPLMLQADPVRLTQVVSNLLHNACKYTGAGGHIDLQASREGGDVVLTIRDDGPGIPPEMLDRVFELFTQVDRTLGRAQGGLGIGLALVKRLVELHGGSVAAQSAGIGCGSVFTLRLPLPAQEVAATVQTAEEAGPGPEGSRRILVVDDNRDAADSLATVLQLFGHEVRTAYDGIEGLGLAAEFRPEVVLLDIGLPGLSGHETARRIRQQPWGAAVGLVAVTGWGQDRDRQLSAAAGFDAHLVKPVDTQALMTLLAALPGARAAPTASGNPAGDAVGTEPGTRADAGTPSAKGR